MVYYEPGRSGRYEAWQINQNLYINLSRDIYNIYDYPRLGVSRKYMALDEEADESEIHKLIKVIFSVKAINSHNLK